MSLEYLSAVQIHAFTCRRCCCHSLGTGVCRLSSFARRAPPVPYLTTSAGDYCSRRDQRAPLASTVQPTASTFRNRFSDTFCIATASSSCSCSCSCTCTQGSTGKGRSLAMAAVAAPASSSSSSSGGLSLTLRQRPHLGWISTGWSGLLTLPESERATIEGKVEVRVGAGQPAAPFLQTLKVELKKTETVLTSKGVKRYFEVRLPCSPRHP